MTSMNMPEAEVKIDSSLVRALLQQQRPDLADLPLVELANGWDNIVYRLGADLTVRMPRRLAAVELLENELRWLPMLAERLPLPIPAPLWSGRHPSCGCAGCGSIAWRISRGTSCRCPEQRAGQSVPRHSA
jgi:hypothetical protein